ncbi:MAG: hypothetical protein GWP19_04365 [Planctomycetia bacterium]|nr:hypothetical protein [Planctomycetia bacterium]
MQRHIQLPFVLLILLFTSCTKIICDKFPPNNRQPNCKSCRILFIGSSYLNYAGNNVVEIFSEFCKKANRDVIFETSVVGGFRLNKHIEYQPTIDKINSQGWDYVILQGNSAYISKKKWHEYIVPYLLKFRELIKYNYDKTSVFYMMPWAYTDGLSFIEGETDTYEEMQINIYNNSTTVAVDLDIALAPVGWAWYKIILDEYGASLYLSDKNHQSISGAFLTASVFYSSIFLEQAPEIDYELTENDNQKLLRETAYNTVIENLDLWNIY